MTQSTEQIIRQYRKASAQVRRKYNTPAESFADHGKFLRDNRRYANAFKHTDDAAQFAREIHKAGYATDPKYSDKLISIINQYGLERFDKIARG